jgi:hypothetical protein
MGGWQEEMKEGRQEGKIPDLIEYVQIRWFAGRI